MITARIGHDSNAGVMYTHAWFSVHLRNNIQPPGTFMSSGGFNQTGPVFSGFD